MPERAQLREKIPACCRHPLPEQRGLAGKFSPCIRARPAARQKAALLLRCCKGCSSPAAKHFCLPKQVKASSALLSTPPSHGLRRHCFCPRGPGVSAAEKKGPASQRHVGPSERFMRQNSKTELLFSADTPALPSFFHAAGGYNVRPCAQHVGHYHLPGLHRGLQPHLVQKADGLKQQALGDRRAGLYRAGAGEGRLPPLRCW